MRAALDPPAELGGYLPFRLAHLNDRLMRHVTRFCRGRHQLNIPEWRTMAILGRSGAMSANSVIAQTRMNKARVSRVVTSLLRAGYITREVDPVDRRRAILALTPGGAKIYRQTLAVVKAFEAEILMSLTAAERSGLSSALTKIEAQLGQG
jgi:DNA-binding MarR family transcriptional regulator